MRFSEYMRGRNHVPEVNTLGDLGVIKFGKGVSQKNEERTPHYEIKKCMEMFETNAIVNSSLNQYILFLVPNKKIKVSSSDPKTQKFLQGWFDQRKGLLDDTRNIGLTNAITGNAPVEKRYGKTSDGRRVLDNIFSVNDMSRIYVNPDDITGECAFVFELPIGIKRFRYMGMTQTPKFYEVKYTANYQYVSKRVYGIAIPSWKMKIFKTGWSRDNLYGRSMLSSAIDAVNIFNEIMSSWDTIAKTRQVDQKILTVDNTDTGISLPPNRLEEYKEQLENADGSYTLFEIPLRILQTDIKTSGNYDLMEGVMDMIRRMIMLSLLPQHLTPWSDSATTQGSEASMPPFIARIHAAQNQLISFLNSITIDELRKTYPFIADDATIVLDTPKLVSDREYIDTMSTLAREGIISADQAKQYLAKMGILDEDVLVQSESPIDEQVKKKDPDTLKEAIASSVTFPTFKKRLEARDATISTKGWKEIEHNDIGGKDVRLVQVDDTTILLFDGLVVVSTFDTQVIKKSTIRKAFDDYKDKLRKEQEVFADGNTEEDDIIDGLEQEVKGLLDSQLQKLFTLIDKSSVKREGYTEEFLSDTVLKKVDGFFKGFSTDMRKSISKVMNKLGAIVIDDTTPGVPKVNDKVKKLLDEKRDLFKKNVLTQIRKTKDSMLADIKTDIANGIAAGKTNKQIKQDIEKRFNYDDGVGWKFDRIVRTDVRQSAAILKLKKLQKLGFEEYEWITVGDDKVRPEHARRNHRIYKIDDALSGRDIFPGGSLVSGKYNINCRCRLVPYS